MPNSLFIYARLLDPLLRNMRRAVYEISGLAPGDAVLDVACGTGAQVFEYARRGLQATGLDADPSMLRQAEYYRARRPGLEPTFVLGDAARLPFGDAAFAGASISLALHENAAAAQDAIVREMRRVVKQGGPIVLADLQAPLPRHPVGQAVAFVEWAAGEENRRNFRAFTEAGGLDAILKLSGLKAVRTRQAALGIIRIVATINRPD
jgi:demethylmenaquinone methyltransferase/2-methoxy-6-polyprenyl-1,4-benzoquinol methylase